nr:MAG TPA: hypothetical protein [Herelleviridae sp.]
MVSQGKTYRQLGYESFCYPISFLSYSSMSTGILLIVRHIFSS